MFVLLFLIENDKQLIYCMLYTILRTLHALTYEFLSMNLLNRYYYYFLIIEKKTVSYRGKGTIQLIRI